MTVDHENRFQDFFEEGEYLAFKNHLYNYLIRKMAIERTLANEPYDRIIEVGSGISPVMTQTDRIVYSELSFLAMKTLRDNHRRGLHVVADATRLPFKTGSFSHAVSSEVLEHVKDDKAVLAELARVLKPGGRLIATFPHRKCYFANDDRYVKHFRRYELGEMEERLKVVGLRPLAVRKVLGPLKKLMMMTAVVLFEATLTFRLKGANRRPAKPGRLVRLAEIPFAWLNSLLALVVRADAWTMPPALASCLLIMAEKDK